MGYYPLMLDVTNGPVVLIGGGGEALLKARSLVASGCRTKLFAPNIIPELDRLLKNSTSLSPIEWVNRIPTASDLEGARLVILTTPDSELRNLVRNWARMRHGLVNVVDDLVASNVIASSIVRRGDLVISISTSGRAPVLARALRQYLEILFDNEWGPLVDEISALRVYVRNRISNPERRRLLITRLVDERVRSLLSRMTVKARLDNDS